MKQRLLSVSNGNLLQKCEGGTVTRSDTTCTGTTVTNLRYDALNRLSQVVKGSGTETYLYDDTGRRIQKTAGSTATNYLLSGPDILAEYDPSWSTPAAQYLHGPALDEPIARITATATQYYHQDGLGSIVAVTDGTGATTGTQRFDAYGNKLASTGTIPQYGYTGREPDATGFVYYRARYYDPTTGRFTQKDPIGFQGGMNLYAYANGNPVNYTDPQGTQAFNNALTNVATQNTSYFGDSTGPTGMGGLWAGGQSLASVQPNAPSYSMGIQVSGAGDAASSPSDSSPLYAASVGVNAAGFAAGAGEYSNVVNNSWLGINGKWNSIDWGGNKWTGPRSNAVEVADAARILGKGLFVVGTTISIAQGASAINNRDYGGLGKSSADIAMGAIGVLGGPPGWVAGGVYFGVDLMHGFEKASAVGADLMCSVSGKC
jgi:RHS repeat-associated protein